MWSGNNIAPSYMEVCSTSGFVNSLDKVWFCLALISYVYSTTYKLDLLSPHPNRLLLDFMSYVADSQQATILLLNFTGNNKVINFVYTCQQSKQIINSVFHHCYWLHHSFSVDFPSSYFYKNFLLDYGQKSLTCQSNRTTVRLISTSVWEFSVTQQSFI